MAEYKKDAEAGVATYIQPEVEPERASGSGGEKPHAGDEDFGGFKSGFSPPPCHPG
jgi:hypothetical protein